MDQRNTLCSHQMLGLQSEQGFRHFHPNHCILSVKLPDYTNQSFHPGLSASRFYRDQCCSFQNLNAVPNFGPSCAVPSNFYIPLSSCFPLNVNEFSRDDQFVDGNRGYGQRKTAELPPANNQNISEPASSSMSSSSCPSNGGLPRWEPSHEAGINLTDCAHFEHPEYQARGNVNTAEGSHGSVRSRSNLVSLPPESAYFDHPNYVLQATHMGQPLHPGSSMRFGMENSISNGTYPKWNYNHPISNMQGTIEMTNMGVPAFPDPSSSLNGPVLMNATPFHQCFSPAHAMQLRSYGHQIQMQAISYPHPFRNLQPMGVNHFTGGLNSGSSFLNLHSNGELAYRPLRMHNAAPDFCHRSARIFSDEDGAVLDISAFHLVENVIDQHQDMRLDIDEMSYEELLALEEQIGDVKTGLTEEYIKMHHKTSTHDSQTKCLPSEESARYSQQNEACIICKDEYLADEIIGTLDCGHSYHGECIRQWLLVKNLCPICKRTAMAKDGIEG